jgi:hypothetical protein
MMEIQNWIVQQHKKTLRNSSLILKRSFRLCMANHFLIQQPAADNHSNPFLNNTSFISLQFFLPSHPFAFISILSSLRRISTLFALLPSSKMNGSIFVFLKVLPASLGFQFFCSYLGSNICPMLQLEQIQLTLGVIIKSYAATSFFLLFSL